MFDESAPLFVRIADELADDIATGVLSEGDRVPSGNELAAFHGINPATAAKGINLLAERRVEFAARYVAPLVTEARRPGIGPADLARVVTAQTAGDAHIPNRPSAPTAMRAFV